MDVDSDTNESNHWWRFGRCVLARVRSALARSLVDTFFAAIAEVRENASATTVEGPRSP